MNKITRFKIEDSDPVGEHFIGVPDPNGEWCRYTSVQTRIHELKLENFAQSVRIKELELALMELKAELAGEDL